MEYHLAFGQIVLGMVGAEGIEHAAYVLVPCKKPGDGLGIAAMLAHAQRQRLQALQKQPGGDRRQRRAVHAQHFEARSKRAMQTL